MMAELKAVEMKAQEEIESKLKEIAMIQEELLNADSAYKKL